MKGFIIFIVVDVIIAAGYGFYKNPDGCRKLGLDFVRDAKIVYVAPVDSTPPTQQPAPDNPTAPAIPTVSPVTQVAPTSVAVQPATTVQPIEAVAPLVDPEIPAEMREWDTQDYALAVKAARQQHKKLLLFFTGSDFCPPCQDVARDVLPAAEFQHWVSTSYIMVTLDFPRHKQQSPALIAQNNALHLKYQTNGWPIFIITDVEGTEIKRIVGCPPTANMLISYFEGTPPPTSGLFIPDTHL